MHLFTVGLVFLALTLPVSVQAESYLDNFGLVVDPILLTTGIIHPYSENNLEPGAILTNANLTGADLSGAQLFGAQYDEATIFPSGNTYLTPPWGINGDSGIDEPWNLAMIPVPEPVSGLTSSFVPRATNPPYSRRPGARCGAGAAIVSRRR